MIGIALAAAAALSHAATTRASRLAGIAAVPDAATAHIASRLARAAAAATALIRIALARIAWSGICRSRIGTAAARGLRDRRILEDIDRPFRLRNDAAEAPQLVVLRIL